ncbi:MAG: excinuclease ABC subunit A, partial [Planctomycetes bacterium]|nr:excinuclease ABC subunit A [Planctomycetota bacterium]
ETFYVLDEPTTGLHFEDVRKLLDALQSLVDRGNSVLVIEHNLEVLKCADWIIDLGPDGGAGGGRLVAEGTPEDLVGVVESYTGQALGAVLEPRRRKKPARKRGKKGRPLASRDKAPDLRVVGARQHNLKKVDARFPASSLTVVTGVSGSGKTSLAFDTLFQEGQRRFIESLSTYARRFLGRLDRAPVDKIEGLLPAIAIDQKTSGRNPRSTVGTSTEILDYLRLMYARVGQPHCPDHGEPLVRNSPSTLAARISKELKGEKGHVLAPCPTPPGLEDADLRAFLDERIQEWKEEGFARYAVFKEGGVCEVRLEEPIDLRAVRSGLWLVVDRVSFGARSRSRLAEAFELAGRWGKGLVAVAKHGGAVETWSLERSCTKCGFHLPLDIHPRFFSFNHHSGACGHCQGIGTAMRLELDALLHDRNKPLFGGAVRPKLGAQLGWFFSPKKHIARTACAMAKAHRFDLTKTPVGKLTKRQLDLVLLGSGDRVYEIEFQRKRGNSQRRWVVEEPWPGLRPLLEEKWTQYESEQLHHGMSKIMREDACPQCDGKRLSRGALGVRVGGLDIGVVSRKTVTELLAFVRALDLGKEDRQIARDILIEIEGRAGFLDDMGLGYLALDRSASTLSGGEAQRIRLASQIGSRLTGTLYVLDEPTVGLHPRDTDRLLDSLLGLRDLGNTVVAVEHDESVIRRADWVVDIGPGAGRMGGNVVHQGTPASLTKHETSVTAKWLRGESQLPPIAERRKGETALHLEDVHVHNLVGATARFPLGAMTVVTGVSGSGKSSLVIDGLLPALREEKGPWKLRADEPVHDVIVVGQDGVGVTATSTPATYTKIYGPIRELFSKTEAARRLGFGPGRFSFNTASGRCLECDGRGETLVEMHFLADVWVRCELCRGKRFDEATLEVTWRDKTIADVLELECSEALDLFAAHKHIRGPLRTLCDVGLGYLRLGQGVHTLSGGEAQRLKLAAELCKPARAGRVYLLDEPTTGLHMEDVARLMSVLAALVDRGGTVIVIEHHMGVARQADWIVDLGPEAGDAGGRVVAQGTPEHVAGSKCSRTARYLAEALADGPTPPAQSRRRRQAKARKRGA